MKEAKTTYCVYKHTTPSNKVYIGQTTNDLKIRWKNGLGYKKCPAFWQAILKYGWENIKHEILQENLTFDEANYWEKFYIDKYQSNKSSFGYNLTIGGQGSTGHGLTTEAKLKLQKANTGKQLTLETKTKISSSLKGRVISDTQKNKISALLKENNPGANIRSKPVICIETQKIFESSRKAGKWLGTTNVSSACHNEKITIHGYHFAFLADINQQEILKEYIYMPPYTDTRRLASGELKTSLKKQKHIKCKETDEIFESLTLAATKYNISIANISANLTGRTNYAGKLKDGTKLHWEYLNG